MNEDLYDVSKYTDEQLYDILDLNNPTDRELEARIIFLINKYSNMQNESGFKLAIFFQNIYNRFFEIENDVVEGFEDPLKFNAKTEAEEGKIYEKEIGKEIKNKTDGKNATSQEIQSTISFDYVKDKFALNPLLKQTIKRIICIDSQYRDNKNTTLSTEFTFNLSEPLRDVVSLKLESIQIPITWYTITNSYGSNFFYLKGNIDGINNDYHDYKIEIDPGNYNTTSSDSTSNIFSVINSSIKDVSNTYTDVNFGDTKISYNTGNSKTTIKVDIQKVYNESSFQLKFPYWSSPLNNRSDSIPSYLGFNNDAYEPFSIHSNESILNTNNINNNYISFTVDNSNNYFDIIQYQDYNDYSSTSTVINNFKINITNGQYYRNTLVNEIKKQLNDSTFLDASFSYLRQIDITDALQVNQGYSYYKMSIKLNRYTVKHIPYSKVVVIFPDESQYNRNTVWTNIQNKDSCLCFDDLQNETSIVYGETNSIQSSFQVSSSTKVYFKCINPPNYASTNDFSMNDIVVKIPPSNYILNDYISEVNKAFTTTNTILNESILNVESSSKNSKFYLNVDIIKNFTSNNWKITFNESSVLNRIFKIPVKTDYELSNSNQLDGSFNNNVNITDFYIFDSSYIMSFSPSANNYGNVNESTYNVYLPEKNEYIYSRYTDLVDDIQTAIKTFYISILLDDSNTDFQTPLSNSYISSTVSENNLIISISLFININYNLTENNYEVYFIDDINNDITDINNSWNKLNIDYSYNLYEIKKSQPSDEQNSSIIASKTDIGVEIINIYDTNNQIQIIPIYDPIGGAYTTNNYITLTIPNGSYSKYQLIIKINELLNDDVRLYGSEIVSYTKKNKEYIKLRININIIYTTKDYKLVFYDPYSFVKCYVGIKSVKNSTWDSTLGWILGFKDYTEYALTNENKTVTDLKTYYLESPQSVYEYSDVYENNQIINTTASLTSDTSCTLNIYNYFMIILDDYIQNHLNDGLVTITKAETSIALPNYSSQSVKICDPTTNTPIISTTANTNGLTSRQIYALNQSLISKRNTNINFSKRPNIKDIFAMIPLKIGGIPNGSYYIETGGNLQNQERVYFGPVNIHRMSIKLVNDHGDTVDLNKVDWSFSFICEQLYRA